MKEKIVPTARSIFVCTQGGGGKKCHGGKKLCAQLKKQVKQRGMQAQVRVCSSGCMNQCSKGPNVMLFPENTWLCRVRERDLDEILARIAADSVHEDV